MSEMDKREDAFESKFAHDAELKFKAQARRNKLLGIWAADLMGLNADEAQDYAKEVIKSDFEEAGDEDVFRKVSADIKEAGANVSEEDLRNKMAELLAQAKEEVLNEA